MRQPLAPKKKKIGRTGTATRRRKKAAAGVWAARVALKTGTVLVVDPSAYSIGQNKETGSAPGWAIFREGKFVEAGVITIPTPKGNLQVRLFEIGECIRAELVPRFGPFDAVIIEEVPLKRYVPGGRASVKGQLSLHYAVGVTYASVRTKRWIFMPPQVWRSYMPEDYVKSDDGDAVAMGVAALMMLGDMTLDPRGSAQKRRKKKEVKDADEEGDEGQEA